MTVLCLVVHCDIVLCSLSSFSIIWVRKRELDVLLLKVSDYDQDISQPHTADQTTTPRGRDIEPYQPQDSRTAIKEKTTNSLATYSKIASFMSGF